MKIERLTSAHSTSEFSCGEDIYHQPLNEYIRRYATQNDRRHNTATYVLVATEGSNQVIGYYTTTVKHLDATVVPEGEKLRGYPMPVALLARLAVDHAYQGQRLGELLLIDALRRIARAAQEIGIRAIEVDAKNEAARRFYEKYGFQPLLDDALHLYLPVKVLLGSKLLSPLFTESPSE